MSSCRTSISGSCSASCAERDTQPLPVLGIDGFHHDFERRRREVVLDAAPRLAEPVADANPAEAPELRDLARLHRLPLHGVSAGEDAERGHPACVEAVPNLEAPGEEPRVGDAVSLRAALDLEDPRRERPVAVAGSRRKQLGDTAHHVFGAGAGERRAEEDGMELAGPRPAHEIAVGGSEGDERRSARPEPLRRAHRHDCGREALLDLVEHTLRVRACAIDLVDEEQRGNFEPLQRAHQDSRLRLHSFHCREHEHAAVEHAEHSLHLGDEVGMAGRVDEIHRHAVDREGDDGRLDRDAAPLLELERVGPRRSLVDAAGRVDHAGGVEEPFGESCLTGVYMRQDPKVERSAKQVSIPSSRSSRPSRLTWHLRARRSSLDRLALAEGE